jgi:ribosomal protein S8
MSFNYFKLLIRLKSILAKHNFVENFTPIKTKNTQYWVFLRKVKAVHLIRVIKQLFSGFLLENFKGTFFSTFASLLF